MSKTTAAAKQRKATRRDEASTLFIERERLNCQIQLAREMSRYLRGKHDLLSVPVDNSLDELSVLVNSKLADMSAAFRSRLMAIAELEGLRLETADA